MIETVLRETGGRLFGPAGAAVELGMPHPRAQVGVSERTPASGANIRAVASMLTPIQGCRLPNIAKRGFFSYASLADVWVTKCP
jgi:hypothetical protein